MRGRREAGPDFLCAGAPGGHDRPRVSGGGPGVTGAMSTLRQRARSDQHTVAWWTRAQWAIESELVRRPRDPICRLEAMTVLGRDATASAAELQVLHVAFTRRLDRPLAARRTIDPCPPTAPSASTPTRWTAGSFSDFSPQVGLLRD